MHIHLEGSINYKKLIHSKLFVVLPIFLDTSKQLSNERNCMETGISKN